MSDLEYIERALEQAEILGSQRLHHQSAELVNFIDNIDTFMYKFRCDPKQIPPFKNQEVLLFVQQPLLLIKQQTGLDIQFGSNMLLQLPLHLQTSFIHPRQDTSKSYQEKKRIQSLINESLYIISVFVSSTVRPQLEYQEAYMYLIEWGLHALIQLIDLMKSAVLNIYPLITTDYESIINELQGYRNFLRLPAITQEVVTSISEQHQNAVQAAINQQNYNAMKRINLFKSKSQHIILDQINARLNPAGIKLVIQENMLDFDDSYKNKILESVKAIQAQYVDQRLVLVIKTLKKLRQLLQDTLELVNRYFQALQQEDPATERGELSLKYMTQVAEQINNLIENKEVENPIELSINIQEAFKYMVPQYSVQTTPISAR